MARAPSALFREEDFSDLTDGDTVKRFLRMLNGFTLDTRSALAKGLTLGDNSAAFFKTVDYTPQWIAPTLSGGWVNYGGGTGSDAGYYRDALGLVHLRGLLKSGTLTSAAFTLPAGYRPATNLNIATPSNAAFGYVFITAAGLVVPYVGSPVWFSLDGISFRAEGAPAFSAVLQMKNTLASRPAAVLVAEAHDSVSKVPVALGSPAWAVSGDQIVVGDLGGPPGRKLSVTFLVLGG